MIFFNLIKQFQEKQNQKKKKTTMCMYLMTVGHLYEL